MKIEDKIKAIRVRAKGESGRVLLENFTYLTLLQIAQYALSLISVPYLARVLGKEGLGAIAFAASVVVWFRTIVDWGFGLTSTRDVAQNKNNHKRLEQIFSVVFWAKWLLTVATFVIYCLLIVVVPKLKENALLLILTFLTTPASIFYPGWLFQGLERMKFLTIFSVSMRLFFTIAIFFVIKDSDDYIMQPVLLFLGEIIVGIVAMYIVIVKWKIRLHFVPYLEVRKSLKSNFDVFLNNLFPNLYNAFSTMLLGFVGGNSANGLLDAGSRFIGLVQSMLSVLSSTFFPFLSRRLDAHRLYGRMHLSVAIFFSILLFIFAPLIIRIFFTEEFYDAIVVLRIMSASLVFLSLGNIYGLNYLIINHRERELRYVTMICSLVGLVISFPLVFKFSYIGAAIVITVTRGMLGVWSMIKAKQCGCKLQ